MAAIQSVHRADLCDYNLLLDILGHVYNIVVVVDLKLGKSKAMMMKLRDFSLKTFFVVS